jgi:biopolymer transport protein TolR
MIISSGRARTGQKSDINITPLVDVALVLLIIFLIVMPAGILHIPVQVPPVAPPDGVPASSQLVVVGHADGTVELDDGTGPARSVDRTGLARTLRPMVEAMKSERVVFVDFDDRLRYEEVVSIMDTIKGMGRDASGREENPVALALKTTQRRGAGRPGEP